jgi:hypothetical protein
MSIILEIVHSFRTKVALNPGKAREPWMVSTLLLATALAALIVIGVCLFAADFVSREATLYYWDGSYYWGLSCRLAAVLWHSPAQALTQIFQSIRFSDYNLIPALPISVSMLAFGCSRLVYELSVIGVYGLLTVLAFLTTAWKIGSARGGEPGWWIVCVSLLAPLFFPGLWRPVLLGYLDLGGVAIALLILLLYFRQPANRLNMLNLVSVGMLLALLVLFRRWYVFWAVSFVVIVALDSCWTVWSLSPRDRRATLSALRVPIVVGLSTGTIVLLLAWPMVLRVLTRDYTHVHQAWKLQETIAGEIWNVVGHFGLVPLVLLAASAIGLQLFGTVRRISLLLTIHLCLTFLLMRRMQDPSPQHWYLYYPDSMLLVSLSLGQVGAAISNTRQKYVLAGFLLVTGLMVTASVYVRGAAASADRLSVLVPQTRAYPEAREDMPELVRLLYFLARLQRDRPGPIYVLSSSETLNYTHLRDAYLSLTTTPLAPGTILWCSEVDRRDGFPWNLLKAQYVLVALPIQYHLRPRDQRVIGIPAKSFITATNIGKAFRRLPDEFNLRNGVKLLVFERTRPITPTEVQELVKTFGQAHADWGAPQHQSQFSSFLSSCFSFMK